MSASAEDARRPMAGTGAARRAAPTARAAAPRAAQPADPSASRGGSAPFPESLLNVLRVGIVMIDAHGRVVLWSPTTTEILGWPDSLAIGRHLSDFFPEGHDPGGIAIYRALLRDGLWRGILPMRHLDGATVELEGRATLLRDPDRTPFILANLVETSRIRAVEQDLAALDGLFTASPLGIALFDTDLRYLRINDALARLSGVHPDDVVGKTVLEVLPEHMSREIHEIQRQVLRTGRSVIDLVMPSPDRSGARSLSFGRLTDRGGRPLGVGCTVIDITERREALEKIEHARQRLSLLDDIGLALADLLDVRRISEVLAQVLVPRFADYSGVMLLDEVINGGELPSRARMASAPLRQTGVAAKEFTPAVERMLRAGQDIAFEPGSIFGRVLLSGYPYLVGSERELAETTYRDDPKVRAAIELGIHSLMVLPLRARGTVLGLLVVSRSGRRTPFNGEDLALAGEVAARASVSLDNARLYARERDSAVMLQRSLLPQRVPEPPGVQVGYRYVPASTGAEAGGDWFDVIPLGDGRVAFVIGDVIGHGLQAAATMGRLRTAVRTLAGVGLPPAALLRHLNELGDDLAPAPDELLMATCIYAIYDPAERSCVLANAGHPPPLLLARGPHTGLWRARTLHLPEGMPLGLEDARFEERRIDMPDGAILVLYTDGLIERRGSDIDEGLERMRTVLGRTTGDTPPLEDLCDRVLTALTPDGTGTVTGTGAQPPADTTRDRAAAMPAPVPRQGAEDDIALLAARLGGLPGETSVSWSFPARNVAAYRARSLVRHTLRDWGLEQLTEPAVLVVSELVTNAVRHARGPVGVRLVRGTRLLVEVSDSLPDPPRARDAAPDDEGGRGLALVARTAQRWGTRREPHGKTIWLELPLPPGPTAP
ncbi:SpoIIE family protein phosphatase [Streptomyces aidingensis]|uniref:PAS domain S-box-containing protein n=1 Tax=Streptomyces aidingensis TaxID=910347 RepID=A0A1I1EYX1_9ACTN|nr:SpoIIE family protein phosphatase [Streptomyces aidingensis]SFB90093.1 PAS domain S-box-containing protein [Streptomyces aidingensis]